MHQVTFVNRNEEELKDLESKRKAILEIRKESGCDKCPRLYQCYTETEKRYKRVRGRMRRNDVEKVL